MTAIDYRPATAETAPAIAGLIYDSSHELLDFLFGNRDAAENALEKLLAKPNGQFGFEFATVMYADGLVAGVELGYDQAQLAAQDLPGVLHMFGAMPLLRWPHLLFRVGSALSGYVPPPAEDAYYINNIAISDSQRGKGLGQTFLDHIIARSRAQGYRCVELDVTDPNTGAIRFYERYGFHRIGQSGSHEHDQRFQLPILNRMRLAIAPPPIARTNNFGHQNSTRVISDISALYQIEVDEVYAPGSIEQLQTALRGTDKPISIGGGRFSMGGQTALPGTLHIDMRGMNRILEIDPEGATVTVESGVRWREIQAAVADLGFAVKIMQTYADFTVGGSISVNCHGRYVGLGPIILSIESLRLVLHDGSLVTASMDENPDLFFGAVGGYGSLGIIAEATLSLARNSRIERLSKRLRLRDYPQFFADVVRENDRAVFHNADMVPPKFHHVRAITWQSTDKAVNRKARKSGRNLYLAEKYMLWAITETPLGHVRREYLYEPLLYMRPKVTLRNREADYDVTELEPLSRNEKTYVLQEYFVPVARLVEFAERMTDVLNRFTVQVVNVSIRHAHPDPGSFLAWAREEVFALVLYYKQGTTRADRERVAVWTRALIDAVAEVDGAYYLPYQPHARHDQFHRCYPNANRLKEIKAQIDPGYRFRNCLWEKYFQKDADEPLFPGKPTAGSEFLTVYGDVATRDGFYLFLQNIYHLYPEHLFHDLIIRACETLDKDEAIYGRLLQTLPAIKPALGDLTYALPALFKQKDEMARQTQEILPTGSVQGYLEIGSTGRYVKPLKKTLHVSGPIYLTNDIAPDNSPPELMERGGIGQVGEFFPLDDYAPIEFVPEDTLELVTCYIGLHHCPREKLAAYIDSIHRILKPGGYFVLRDHDAGTDASRTFCSLVHTVFNAGLGASWETDRMELRLFEGLDFWRQAISARGFHDTERTLLQDHDPSLNTLMCFKKEAE